MWSPAAFGRLPANVGSALSAVRRSLLLRIPARGIGHCDMCNPYGRSARAIPGHAIDFGRDLLCLRPVERGIW